MRSAQERSEGGKWLQALSHIWRQTNIDTKQGDRYFNRDEAVKKSGFLLLHKGTFPTFLSLSGNDSPSNLGHVIHTGAHPPTACMCVCVFISERSFYCVC